MIMNILEFIGQIAVPALALIVSGLSFYLTNRMNKKVNRKDYEISENLKYELLKLIAALRALDAKAVMSPHVNKTMDYSQEIQVISNLRMSPGYLVFLHSINNDDDRFWIDFNIQLLSVVGKEMSMQDIRKFSNRLLDLLKNKTNLQGILDLEVLDLMKEFCEMKGTAPEFNDNNSESSFDKKFKTYIEALVKQGNSDPDVLVWYGVLFSDTEILEKALKDGGRPNITQEEIIKKYKQVYDSIV